MTEKTLAKDTAAFEDTTQDCMAIQAKVAEFKNPTKSLFEELEALAKAKAVISEKTGDVEYRPGQPVSVVIARKFGKFSNQRRAFDRVGAAHISCCFSDVW